MSYSGAYCFIFWYHMYGSSIGSLNIYTQSVASAVKQRKWMLQGNQGNTWRKAEVDINSTSSGNYKVRNPCRRTSADSLSYCML